MFNLNKRMSCVLQDEIIACGHACVVMVSNFYGHQVNMEYIKKLLPTSLHGTNLLDLNNLLEQLGFKTHAIKLQPKNITQINGPAILYWENKHFVVFNKIKDNKIIIHDPAKGILQLSMEEFSELFSGILLTVEPKLDMQIIFANNNSSWWRNISKIHGIKRIWSILLVLCFSMEVIALLNPLLLQYITDDLVGNHNLHDLLILSLGFLFLININAILDYLRGHLVVTTMNRLVEHSSNVIFEHILKLPLDYFMKRQKGDIQSRFHAVDELQKKISEDFVSMLLDSFVILMHVLVMTIYSFYLSLLVFCGLILVFIVRLYSFEQFKHNAELSMQNHAAASTYFLETIQSMLTVKTFVKEKLRLVGWRSRYIKALNNDLNNSVIQLKYQVFQKTLFNIEQLLTIFLGAVFIIYNKFSIGMLIAFLAYRLVLIQKSSMVLQYIFEFKTITLSVARLRDIIYADKEEDHPAALSIIPKFTGNITLKNINYSYGKNMPNIINNFSMSVEAGEKVALVGASGCGKTTLLKIMLGLIKPSSGEIYLDDTPFNWFYLSDYRKYVSAVMQDDTLLSGSLLENISFFSNNIDLEWVYEVCKIAQIHEDIIKFPMGYETIIGELGSCLSGGQKQRIILARALYKKPKILFLDEATSHLDIYNEKQINSALKQLSMTQIIVAHRQETINSADRVIII